MPVTKHILVGFLITITLLNTLSNVAVLSYFYSNQTFIAESFCINKDKPELHCDGNCYLSQKLLALEQEQNEAMQNIPVEFNFIVFCSELNYAFVQPKIEVNNTVYHEPFLAIHQCVLNSVFQPPEA